MYIVPPFGPNNIGERRTTFAKTYGLKVRCLYGEHVRECRSPKPFGRLKLNPSVETMKSLGARDTLPVLSTLEGQRGVLELWDGTRKSDKQFTHSSKPAPKTNNKLISTTFGAKTHHRQPKTHKTHHNPDSGEAITFPHIVYSAPFCGSGI